MKVTAIQQQKKRINRYSIFIDGRYSFSLSDVGLLESQLSLGQELDKTRLNELNQAAEFDNYYSRVLNYISIRSRSVWEIKNYLRLRKCPDELSHEIIQKLSTKGLIDDTKFAIAWVESRRLLKSVSKRRLISELRAKRVANETITLVINEDETNETTVLKDLIAQKRKITRYQDDLKLMQYLSRQGFNYEDIKSALSES